MRTEHEEQPSWKSFKSGPVLLPTSKNCPNKGVGCYIAKAHALINDAESYLREAMNQMEPNSDQEMEDLVAIKQYADALLKSERAMRDILLRNGTQCPDAERCRCL